MSTFKRGTPWEVVHLDMVGPWTVKFRLTKEDRTINKEIQALTIVDRATGWPEFCFAKEKKSKFIAKLFDKVWLCRYPRPDQAVYDNGSEFVGNEFQELLNDYGIEAKPTTVKNPQANSVVERLHLSIADML